MHSNFPATLIHLAHPIGSFLSGILSDGIGRRKTLILVNIPFAIGWIVLGFSQSLTVICIVFTMFGILLGLNEASIATYTIEIWYVLCKYKGIFF